MSSPRNLSNPLQNVPEHIQSLLSRLHTESLTQEAALGDGIYKDGAADFDKVMRDKFIALDEDKSQYVYQLCRATNAKTVVEAGTSYGVSTIYLALAVSANVASSGGPGKVVATEYESAKASKAREHWRECGDVVSGTIDLREGNLLETLKEDLENVDLLLLDIWTPMALPTLKIVQPKLRRGAIIIADNTISGADRYKELLEYLRNPKNGFITSTLPFKNGLEMSVYLPSE